MAHIYDFKIQPFEAYRAAFLKWEAELDADLRRGVIGGEQTPYRYTGPPMVPTCDDHIRGAYMDHVHSMAHGFAMSSIYAYEQTRGKQ